MIRVFLAAATLTVTVSAPVGGEVAPPRTTETGWGAAVGSTLDVREETGWGDPPSSAASPGDPVLRG